jgi:hypothetical protein
MNFLENYLFYLQELVSIPGGNEEIELYGRKFYTSEKLREQIKKICEKNLNNKASKIISNLIDKKRLIPVYISSSLFQHLFKKKRYDKLGHTKEKISYIFIDPKIIFTKDSDIIMVLIHELIHLANNSNPEKFEKLNYKTFITFYKEFFTSYLDVKEKNKIKDSIFENIITDLNSMFKKGTINFYKLYIKVFKSLEKETSLSEDEYVNRFKTLIDYLDKSYESFAKEVPYEIFSAADKAYIKIAGRKSETIGQEFYRPSEIIAVSVELNPKSDLLEKNILLIT